MKRPIFLHVPKTAGSSIRTLITANYQTGAVLNLYGDRAEILATCREHLGKLSSTRLVQGHAPHGCHRFLDIRSPQYFFFLREPVARTLSDIEFGRRNRDHGFHAILADPALSATQRIEKARNLIYYRNNMCHFVSGAFFTREISLLEFNLAVDNLWNSAFVGITEHTEESILIMGRMLGWKYFVPQRCNVSPHPTEDTPQELHTSCASFLEYDLHLYQVALDLFEGTARRYGDHLEEAAHQLRELLREQSLAHPDLASSVYLMGAPLGIPIHHYAGSIPKDSPLARWAATGMK